MTVLDCTVLNCAYNRDRSCRKDNIQVEGDSAHVTEETCCGSFEFKGCGCANGSGYAKKETEVYCKAEDCTFNRANKCSAEHICISGQNADTLEQTECASFVCS